MDNKEKIKKFKKAHKEGKEDKLHQRIGGKYIGDIVYGANDGIITTFAIVSAVTGASLASFIILIIGFANLLADGFSMAAGDFLAVKSNKDYREKQRRIEEWEVDNIPEEEKKELRQIYVRKGFKGKLLNQVVNAISKNKKVWVDTMITEELNIPLNDNESPWRKALATFLAFIIAGFMPLLPYVFSIKPFFQASMVITVLTLFIVGSARSIITGKNWFKSGMEMLVVGVLAAGVAYFVGWFLSSIAAAV